MREQKNRSPRFMRSLNQPALAAEQLSEAFHHYAGKSNLSKATLTYKRLSRLRPCFRKRLCCLPGSASVQTGVKRCSPTRPRSMAIGRCAKTKRLFRILERLAELDPTAERFQQIADAALKQGLTQKAAAAYGGVAIEFQRHGIDGSAQFAKAYELDPANAIAALGHGTALLETDPMQAARILEPLANYPSSPVEAREPYGIALMRSGRPRDAEPHIWELFELDPRSWLEKVVELIGHTIDFGDEQHAVDLSQRLEDFQRRVGMRREFVALTKRMAAGRNTGPVYLEYLATLSASANHDTDLTVTLARLFDHYMATGEFERATDALNAPSMLTPTRADIRRVLKVSKARSMQVGWLACDIGWLDNRIGTPVQEEARAPQSSRGAGRADGGSRALFVVMRLWRRRTRRWRKYVRSFRSRRNTTLACENFASRLALNRMMRHRYARRLRPIPCIRQLDCSSARPIPMCCLPRLGALKRRGLRSLFCCSIRSELRAGGRHSRFGGENPGSRQKPRL